MYKKIQCLYRLPLVTSDRSYYFSFLSNLRLQHIRQTTINVISYKNLLIQIIFNRFKYFVFLNYLPQLGILSASLNQILESDICGC